MRQGFEHQPTNSPEMDARGIEAGKTASREKPTAGKTATRTNEARAGFGCHQRAGENPKDLANTEKMRFAPFPWLPYSAKQR